jgi:hypothetical protein
VENAFFRFGDRLLLGGGCSAALTPFSTTHRRAMKLNSLLSALGRFVSGHFFMTDHSLLKSLF